MAFLIGILCVAFELPRVKADGTIYITADGGIEPSTVNITSIDNVTYTFIGNINDSIVVQRINIIVDGAGYTLNGTGTGQYAGFTVEYVDPYEDDNVTIQNVNIVGFGVGIGLISTENITISDNNITDNTYGIWAAESMNNMISGNNITYNEYGIHFNTVFNTEIYENNITDNDSGVLIQFCTNNKFYHNWFVNNVNHTNIEQYNPNAWNETYPIGGNYWDDFQDLYPGVVDAYSGPYQNESGSDGFWDHPYEIDEDNTDYYPIVPEFPGFVIVPLFMIITLLTIAARRKQCPI